jgi:hypothetical protein
VNNRIDPTPVVITVPRQTPKNDFGEVLARTANGMAKLGGAILSSASGMPVVSAAVSAVTSLASSGGRSPGQVAAPALPVASVPGATASSAGGFSGVPGAGADQYGGGMVEQMHQSSMQSLYLQVAMQQESREYNAISNVLKVRHDSAKAAINNIR